MNIQNIEKKEKNMATFEVKVPADVFDNAVNEAYKKNKNHLYVAGFRKGKAPRAVIEGMYGKEVFYPDAIEALAEDAFEAGRADCGFECVGAPSLIDQKVTEDKELIYTFEVGMYPEVELGQYKGLEVPQNHEAFDESKVDEEMHNVQKRNARLLDVEREAKMGDHVTIDFAGFIDGEQFDGGTAKEQVLTLGSGMFIPGFESQLVGAHAGSDVLVTVTFPKDYRATELAGTPAEVRCHIVEVREKSAYELDDVFAKEVGGCQTLEEMKQKLRQSLQDYYDERAEMEVQDTLMRQAAATLDYTPSAQELKEGIDAQVELLKAQLGRKGLTLEAYLQFTGKTEQQIRDDAKPEAENSLRIQKSAERIALLEGLTATDEDYANELAAICRQNGLTMEQLKPHMNAQFEASVRDNIRMKKAIAFVRANADVTVVDAPASKD